MVTMNHSKAESIFLIGRMDIDYYDFGLELCKLGVGKLIRLYYYNSPVPSWDNSFEGQEDFFN
jgi:hypothetical protein